MWFRAGLPDWPFHGQFGKNWPFFQFVTVKWKRNFTLTNWKVFLYFVDELHVTVDCCSSTLVLYPCIALKGVQTIETTTFETWFIWDYDIWNLFLWDHIHMRLFYLRPHSFETYSFKTTFIWDHILLRPHLFETTFIWDHIHLRPHSFETTFIWDHIHLRPHSFETTFIWKHIHFRSHSFYAT